MRFTIEVAAHIETVFDTIADLPNYGSWLSHLGVFGGTVDVIPYPVQLGSRYRDVGPVEKPGIVTEYERPIRIGFRHTVLVRKAFLRTDIEAIINYTLRPTSTGVFVERCLTLEYQIPWALAWLAPFVLSSFRQENLRTLAALKVSVRNNQSCAA